MPNASNPITGYPISDTSQIILSQCYANHGNTPPVAASVVDFLSQQHYARNSAILNGYGFAALPAAFQTSLVVDLLSSQRDKLNIGNTSVCAAFADR